MLDNKCTYCGEYVRAPAQVHTSCLENQLEVEKKASLLLKEEKK